MPQGWWWRSSAAAEPLTRVPVHSSSWTSRRAMNSLTWAPGAAGAGGFVMRSLRLFDVLHQGVEPFGERRMDVDGAFQQGVRSVREHEGAQDLDQFPPFQREDGCPEDAVAVGVHDELHQAGGLIPLDGA